MTSWIDTYEFSTRAYNVLRENKVASAQDAVALGINGLREFRNCGYRTAREILDVLSNIGWRNLTLADAPTEALLEELMQRRVLKRRVIYEQQEQ